MARVAGRLTRALALALVLGACASDESTQPTTAPTAVSSTSTSSTTTTAPTTTTPPTTAPEVTSPHAATEVPRLVEALLGGLGEDVESLDYGPDAVGGLPGLDEYGEATLWAYARTPSVEIHVGNGDWSSLPEELEAAGSAPHDVDGVAVYPIPTAGAGLAQALFGLDAVAVGDDLLAVADNAESPDAADAVGAVVSPSPSHRIEDLEIIESVRRVARASSFLVRTGGTDPAVDWTRRNARAGRERLREAMIASGAVLSPDGPVLYRACGFDGRLTSVGVEFSSADDAIAAARAYDEIFATGLTFEEPMTWGDQFPEVSIGVDDGFVVAVIGGERWDLCFESPIGWTNEFLRELGLVE